MASSFHGVSPYKDLEFSPAACSGLFRAYLNGDGRNLVFILSEQDGEPHGMIIGMASQPLFSQEIMATEIAWWVDPEYRNTRDSLLLISAYEDWSKRVGAKITQVAMLDDVTDLSRLYQKRGFTKAETSYIREQNGSV